MALRYNDLTKVSEFRFKLYVKEFDRTREFYEHLLEFPVLHSWNRGDKDRGIMFDTGAGIIELLSPPDGYKPLKGCGLSLEVQNVEKLWEKLKDHPGIIFGLRKNNWGDTSFCINDPGSLRITFFTKDTS